MPLLKTIRDYFRKEKKRIKVEVGFSRVSSEGISISNSCKSRAEFYFETLHEFIHLDRKRATGSHYGWGEKDTGMRDISDPVEQEIEKEVRELILQNTLAYRCLRKQLNKYHFWVAMSEDEYLENLDDLERERNHR